MKDSIRANIPFYITDYDVKQILDNAVFHVIEHKTQGKIKYEHIKKYTINPTTDIIDITINENITHLSMAEFMQKIIAFLKEQTERKQDTYLFYDELYRQDSLDHTAISPQTAYKMVLYALKKS